MALKLLFLVTEDWAFVSHRLPLAVAAKQAGYDVAVATRVGPARDEIEKAGIRVIPIGLSRSGLSLVYELRTLVSIIGLYRREAPDIVHHVAMKPVLYGSIAARIAGLKGIVNALVGLGYIFSSRDLKARILKPLVRLLLKFALGSPRSNLIVQNNDDFALFTEQELVPAGSVHLIRGSGVDPRHYHAGDPVGSNEPVVVLPARILRDKGVIEFVEAARILKARGVKARFILCGAPDPLNPTSLSDDEVKAYVSEGVVECWGWQADMGPVWKQAQVVCLPSYREGLPKALLEAAASSLPIVATDVPGCREICRPGENGWLVPARDSARLADALDEALRREDLRVSYGKRGREIVEQELSLSGVIAKTLAIYRSLLVDGVSQGERKS